MKSWLRSKSGGLVTFAAITLLVAGGLGWSTAAALRLEQEQVRASAEEEQNNRLRLALWRLDSLVASTLAKEDSRPYHHYIALSAPAQLLQPDGKPWQPGAVLEPSPLLSAEMPDWLLLHFQVDPESGWTSPEIVSPTLVQLLQRAGIGLPESSLTSRRRELLVRLSAQCKPDRLLARVREQGTRPPLEDVALLPAGNTLFALDNSAGQAPNAPPMAQAIDPEYRARVNRQVEVQQRAQGKSQNEDAGIALRNLKGNGEDWLASGARKQKRGEPVDVRLGAVIPLWLDGEVEPERLLLARAVEIGKKSVCQGIVLDVPRLERLLAEEVRKDLFPEARVVPVHEQAPFHSERTMAVLPLQLDPGPAAFAAVDAGWTPLRMGLILAWVAAVIALTAVALVGWSLIDLSERRIRFVSAVTHELRTPLTTLRLYLDMLAGGMVQEAKQREEYLQTLNTEADRLNRLVSNVLDFSRLENQRPRLNKTETPVCDLLDQVRTAWQGHCQTAGKEFVVENQLAADASLRTDVHLVEQILGNLIENACKYSRGAEDRRIWLRARASERTLVFEVEDCGSGVPAGERRSIFRPFRRGRGTETTGGAGLGLALASRWADLLGGRLILVPPAEKRGACFQLQLPLPG